MSSFENTTRPAPEAAGRHRAVQNESAERGYVVAGLIRRAVVYDVEVERIPALAKRGDGGLEQFVPSGLELLVSEHADGNLHASASIFSGSTGATFGTFNSPSSSASTGFQ